MAIGWQALQPGANMAAMLHIQHLTHVFANGTRALDNVYSANLHRDRAAQPVASVAPVAAAKVA